FRVRRLALHLIFPKWLARRFFRHKKDKAVFQQICDITDDEATFCNLVECMNFVRVVELSAGNAPDTFGSLCRVPWFLYLNKRHTLTYHGGRSCQSNAFAMVNVQ